MGKLNPPRVHFYDATLVAAAEAAKFRQKDFSDCHWCTQLTQSYKETAYTKTEYDRDKAAGRLNGWALKHGSALELVIRCYVNQGAKAARKLATLLEKEGESFPAWMKLKTDADWLRRVAGPPPRFRFDVHGFICGQDTRPLDGD